ncbi:hypothetical protein AB0P15_34110 [Streptomyces sp. NPDC087917]|uniref:hypothetical protein n=1 Tax=unclassified Streptomyces TaxID=2593676 RepID=UPI0034335AA2
MEQERITGFVQYFNRAEGWGYLVLPGQDNPLRFEHASGSDGCGGLSVDQQVTFIVEFTERGFVARNLRH